jgi:hypothetical protein
MLSRPRTQTLSLHEENTDEVAADTLSPLIRPTGDDALDILHVYGRR